MRPLTPFIRVSEHVTFVTARTSQALVIAGTHCLMRSATGPPRALARLVGVDLERVRLLPAEPSWLIDRPYTQAQRLLSLHREFAHRMMEAIDTREPPPHQAAAGATMRLVP